MSQSLHAGQLRAFAKFAFRDLHAYGGFGPTSCGRRVLRGVEFRSRAQSPQARAALMTRKVLLFDAGRDGRVAIRSVTHYAALLRRLRRKETLFIELEAGHRASSPLTRQAFLYLTGWILRRHLQGSASTSPDLALAAHLEGALTWIRL